eukprot:3037487-Pyramimonas_sp.AAC.1
MPSHSPPTSQRPLSPSALLQLALLRGPRSGCPGGLARRPCAASWRAAPCRGGAYRRSPSAILLGSRLGARKRSCPGGRSRDTWRRKHLATCVCARRPAL